MTLAGESLASAGHFFVRTIIATTSKSKQPQVLSSVPDPRWPHILRSSAHLPHRTHQLQSWQPMANLIITNSPNQQFSICPTCASLPVISPLQLITRLSNSNGRQTVGDGAYPVDTPPRIVAVCHRHGHDDLYYYSTTFSGGPEVTSISFHGRSKEFSSLLLQWRF